jgi:hypothetical protein
MNINILINLHKYLIFGTICIPLLVANFSLIASNKDISSFAQTSSNNTIESNKIMTNNANSTFGNQGNSIKNTTHTNVSNSVTSGFERGVVEYPNLSKTNQTEVVIQNTSMSVPAPVRHSGQSSHEVVFALPLRDDGKVWHGTVTFTASKPIEVEILHPYSPIKTLDSTHREPYHAVLPGNKSIAITHLRNLVDVPIEINGIGISSGRLNFIGNALLFHKTSGEPFTVTYTIDALVKDLTFKQQEKTQ